MNINLEKLNNQTQLPQINHEIEEAQYINPKNKDFLDIKTKLQDVLSCFISKNEKTVDEQIQDMFLDLDFAGEYVVEADKIGLNDAAFFVNILNQNELINYSVQEGKISLFAQDNSKIQATNSLLGMLKTSFETKKPIRLDFENNITVILKLDNEGKIQTHFLPGNAEVEAYLKNNIQSLKQAFDNQEINYSHLGYSKYKENSKKEKRGNKQ